jgi:membrane fusion protein (multidrug efflux system)
MSDKGDDGDHDARDSDDENSDDDDKDDKDSKDDKKDDNKESSFAFLKNPLVRVGIAIIVVALIIGAIIWWLIARQYEDTDDAFIDTHIVHMSPQTNGQVLSVYVTDNQFVHAGQSLVEIDPSDANARIAQIEAQEVQAETQVRQAMATEEGAAAQALNASHDLGRYRELQRTTPAAVAQQQIDQATATAANAQAQRNSAAEQIAGAQAQIKVLKAQLASAQLTLGYTHIVAPVDGHITQKNVAVGNYVAPGQELLAIVPVQVWVTANFKETQLTHMRRGQPVTIVADACTGDDIRGHVDSIQRGAGQAFGILPPENATGNYVKVVQRVPVKILIDRVPRNCPLGPGMSVEPTVKVR